jgi:trehalose 6-phosphate phosphatase
MPELHSGCALFLDIDGTLLEIAASPDAVVVPPFLAALLGRVSSWLGGALAVVSGRPLAQIDSLLAPLVLCAAGEHGAVLRLPDGTIEAAGAAQAMPPAWRTKLMDAARHWPGVLVEPKPHSVAVHFRNAPMREDAVRQLVENIVADNPADFEVLPAAMAFEIRNRNFTKAGPVIRLMSQAPFAGRIPVFIGDDVTDHDGFRAALSLGGMAVDVHQAFGGKPSGVLRWLDASVPGRGMIGEGP